MFKQYKTLWFSVRKNWYSYCITIGFYGKSFEIAMDVLYLIKVNNKVLNKKFMHLILIKK
jgi:hypothetical protein